LLDQSGPRGILDKADTGQIGYAGQRHHLRHRLSQRGHELLDVFEAEGLDTAFVNTFARYDLPHRRDPRADFDLASYGVVKVLDGQGGARGQRYRDMPWEPEAAFTTLADCYGR
jgi:hypothetical protein